MFATAYLHSGSETLELDAKKERLMEINSETETVTTARDTILKAVQGISDSVTIPPRLVADAFPGTDRTERCEMLLDWAETHGLDVKSHKACDPEEMCEEWPCGPIDFEPRDTDTN
jgi:hypothetical protein